MPFISGGGCCPAGQSAAGRRIRLGVGRREVKGGRHSEYITPQEWYWGREGADPQILLMMESQGSTASCCQGSEFCRPNTSDFPCAAILQLRLSVRPCVLSLLPWVPGWVNSANLSRNSDPSGPSARPAGLASGPPGQRAAAERGQEPGLGAGELRGFRARSPGGSAGWGGVGWGRVG